MTARESLSDFLDFLADVPSFIGTASGVVLATAIDVIVWAIFAVPIILVVGFVVLGIVGVLWFGIQQIF